MTCPACTRYALEVKALTERVEQLESVNAALKANCAEREAVIKLLSRQGRDGQ